jgi:hypothetical protein
MNRLLGADPGDPRGRRKGVSWDEVEGGLVEGGGHARLQGFPPRELGVPTYAPPGIILMPSRWIGSCFSLTSWTQMSGPPSRPTLLRVAGAGAWQTITRRIVRCSSLPTVKRFRSSSELTPRQEVRHSTQLCRIGLRGGRSGSCSTWVLALSDWASSVP